MGLLEGCGKLRQQLHRADRKIQTTNGNSQNTDKQKALFILSVLFQYRSV